MRPLIEDGTTRGLIQRTVMQIASALAQRQADTPVELADGALLRSYVATDVAFPDPEDRAGRLLADAVRRFNRDYGTQPPLSLETGGARIGWTIAHLASPQVASDRCARLDAMLSAALAPAVWNGHFSLQGGLAGFGVYALERGAAGRQLATRVLDHLEAAAIRSERGIAWFTRPQLLPSNHVDIAPAGYWNLGLPHGTPGVIALLARYIAAGIEPARARVLLDGAVAFVLSVAAPSPFVGRYAAYLPTTKPVSSRLAWCHGDLGIAAALVGAGIHAREPAWTREGTALARACAARTLDQAHIRDAGICHGAAGIAHMLHRMGRATGDATLLTAAAAWVVETLRMQNDAPIAGYPSVYEIAGELELEPDATLPTGCAGVALVLHAAISEVEPRWDRMLLLDLPMS